jgi:hypothetical protein
VTYYPGSVVRVSGRFIDKSTNQDVDPTAVILQIKKASGALIDVPDARRLKAGNYYYDVTVDEPGTWFYRWTSTGVNAAADEGSFYVEPSSFA